MDLKQTVRCLFILCIVSLALCKACDQSRGSSAGVGNAARDTLPASGTHHQTMGVTEHLPVFYENLAERLTFPMSWSSGNFTDFNQWKKTARDKVLECMQYAPPRVPFEPVVTGTEDRGSYVAKKIVLNLSADSRVLAYILVPKGDGPFPAVLLLHDHGGRFDIGKEKMIRPFGVPEECRRSAREWVDINYSGRFVGDELAERGYVCFASDALNWSDRGGGGYEGQQSLANNLMFLGASLAGVMAYEDTRAAEFLAGIPETDPARVAAVGHSMGGYRAWMVTALSDHIAAGAAICWMATVKGLEVPGNNLTRGNSAFNMLLPGIHNFLDFPDIASIACPKPMLFYNGSQDHLSPVPAVKDAYRKMHLVWASRNADQQLVTRLWDYEHIFNGEMQDEAFKWLDTVLK